ncbi:MULTISPECIES: hypothetical protein [unclassified Virgibacillus]|uniref:hypothetical protein n=1 Tax=unclassified Virgibacillus TaxID=2620237 RepID=UPI00090B444E|nr:MULTISPECIES: hypothetical protein [unclassified Virgibacillus]API92922.1 hypothetical protein BKP57_14555 [Virgibacillus sp. 6R]MBS7428439.1 hypothetical protein [Virgibacillus sp. 19R1-5]
MIEFGDGFYQEWIGFHPIKMKKMIHKDLLLKRMYNGLGGTDDALEALFYEEIYGDSIMEQEYLKSL